MRRGLFLLTLVAAMVFACAGVVLAQQGGRTTTPASEDSPSFRGQNGAQVAPGKMIVKIKEGKTEDDLAALNRRNGASTDAQLAPGLVPKLFRVNLPRGLEVAEAVGRYKGASDVVEYVEPDYLQFADQTETKSATDPYYTNNSLWGLNNTGSAPNNNDISAPEAWYKTTGNTSKPLVAVIDEGVQYTHEDLAANIWTNPGEIAGNNIDDDGNGLKDDIRGWDFANNDNSTYDGTGDDHGTHVAGTIGAAANNGKGVVGVNWDTDLITCKFLGSSGGTTSNAIRCLDYVVQQGASVSNNSWGGGGRSGGLLEAINRARAKGHIFVAAAGNDGTNNDTIPHYPSSYDADNIIAVAATGKDDVLRSWSNYGATSVDLAAPGSLIYSTVPGNRKQPSSYSSYSGTSMATPHVTGVVALIWANEPTLTYNEVRNRILSTVDRPTSLADNKVASKGRLNAYKAVTAAEPSTTP